MKKHVAIIITSFFCLYASSQVCEKNPGVISAYYTHTTSGGKGAGLEAGMMREDFPLGIFIGCSYTKQTAQPLKEETDFSESYLSSFYLKAAARLLKPTNKFNAFLIASPQMSFRSEFDFQAGIKFMAPITQQFAIYAEPLYSTRQKSAVFNFHLAVQL
jgi:hypothetical protein